MATYILRRLIQTIGLLFLLSIILFALVNLAPGGPLSAYGARRIRPEKIEILKRQFGLDKPLPVQYLYWLAGNDWVKVDTNGDGMGDEPGSRKGILRGDFGFSYRTREPVLKEILGVSAPEGPNHLPQSIPRRVFRQAEWIPGAEGSESDRACCLTMKVCRGGGALW